MRFLLILASTRLSFAVDIDLSIYRRTLYQPYSVCVSRNSSKVIRVISNKANVVIYSILIPLDYHQLNLRFDCISVS